MPKLTDSAYFLPTIKATFAGPVQTTGRTQPMIVQGLCTQTGVKGDYVVKFKGSPQMAPNATFNELVGSYLAMELDFTVPEPVVVNIDDDTLILMRRHEHLEYAKKSLGFNFGSEYLPGKSEIIEGQSLSASLEQQLVDLLAFDIFIGNPDRRKEKPNFLSDGESIYLLDHELSMNFAMYIPPTPQPWLISEFDLTMIRNHVCFNLFKGKNPDFTNFINKLDVINEDFWGKAANVIPKEWINDHFQIIKSYLSGIITNRQTFHTELNRILT